MVRELKIEWGELAELLLELHVVRRGRAGIAGRRCLAVRHPLRRRGSGEQEDGDERGSDAGHGVTCASPRPWEPVRSADRNQRSTASPCRRSWLLGLRLAYRRRPFSS